MTAASNTLDTTAADVIRRVLGGDRTARKALLRAQVVRELEQGGFVYRDGLLALPEMSGDTKELIRQLHGLHREAVLVKSGTFLDEWEDKVLEDFASGREVMPDRITPIIQPVETRYDRALFRFATLHWSVPVSNGYGRRIRFLVRDGSNGKLLGVFALGDPVFNLGVRDRLIGWTHEQRQRRLYNVFDAYVLGAVEPYRELIGGKLVALCALANETAQVLTNKYSGTRTIIREEEKIPDPVLITTTSSLGHSSVYNRLKYHGRWALRSVGFTEGYGHFHFSEDLFMRLIAYLRDERQAIRGHEYGQGPNWRIRTLRKALTELGLDGDLLRHGIRREVFVGPRALGWRAFLRGETDYLRWHDYPVADLAAWWRERWAVPRAERGDTYRTHERESMRLTPRIELYREP